MIAFNINISAAQKIGFTVKEFFNIRKLTVNMSLNEIFAFLQMKADEVGDKRYLSLANTMIQVIEI